MPGTSTSQVKTALAEQRAARQKLANFVQPHSAAQRPESASQQALNKLLQSSFTTADVDLKKFETVVILPTPSSSNTIWALLINW
jgi:hypothetical protein